MFLLKVFPGLAVFVSVLLRLQADGTLVWASLGKVLPKVSVRSMTMACQEINCRQMDMPSDDLSIFAKHPKDSKRSLALSDHSRRTAQR
jgi:hypothetical protein